MKDLSQDVQKEHFKLIMEFDGNLGWRFAPSQHFSEQRFIDDKARQVAGENCKKQAVGLFSGSTGWGWGIHHQADTLHSHLSNALQAPVFNYSCVSYNLYKIYNQMQALELSGELSEKNYVYFGVCEAYTLSHFKNLSDNPRDLRVRNTLGNFLPFYYNRPLPIRFFWRSLRLKLYFWARKLGLKKEGSFRVKPKAYSNEALKSVLLERGLLKQVGVMIDKIASLNTTVVFVLEPSLYHKQQRSENEEKVLRLNMLKNPNIEHVFDVLYDYIRSHAAQNNFDLIDASDVLKTVSDDIYRDYCHPNGDVLAMVSKRLKR